MFAPYDERLNIHCLVIAQAIRWNMCCPLLSSACMHVIIPVCPQSLPTDMSNDASENDSSFMPFRSFFELLNLLVGSKSLNYFRILLASDKSHTRILGAVCCMCDAEYDAGVRNRCQPTLGFRIRSDMPCIRDQSLCPYVLFFFFSVVRLT